MSKFDLKNAIKERKMLVTAHRGANGGNIPCNSMQCYQIAYNQGADILEMDLTASSDGELFMLHPGMERVHTTIDSGYLGEITAEQVRKHFLKNQDLTPTQYGFVTLGEVLDEFKGKCFLNIDKFWDNPEKIAYEIRKRNMQDQVIVKSDPNNGKIIDLIEKYAPDMQFLAIISSLETSKHEELKRRNINYVGVEVLFGSDDHPLVSNEYITKMHDEGYVVWGNSIVYDYRANISGEHTDDVAVLGDEDKGWGFFAKKKFDIIQTDWLIPCVNYLKRKGYKN